MAWFVYLPGLVFSGGKGARALALVALLTACAPRQARGAVSEELLSLAHRRHLGDFDAITKRRYLRVLVVSSRMLYFADRGRQRGLTYDVFRYFEQEENRKLEKRHLGFHVIFIPVSRDELVPRLRDGTGDVAAANLTITSERAALVDFTEPVYRGVDEVVVTGPDSPAIDNLDDLSGQEIFVRKSSSYHESLVALNDRFRARGKPQVSLRAAPEDLDDEDVLEMVNAGLVKIVVVDSHLAQFWAKVLDDIRIHRDVAVRRGGEIAWMIRKGSPKLKSELDAFIRAHRTSGVGGEFLRRYLRDTKYVKDAVSEAEMKKFREVVGYFRKYGGEYRLDPLLMAAQGYQESQLDQSARSASGAVGVMQVLPRTGDAMAVGDIRRTEPNVHAGVKYIRLMIDKYYADEPMTDLNRGLFAFASYNAGPARIRKLRGAAAKRGLDPNVWFNNVEVVVAETLGRETTRYVSNIYKYYVAYKLLEDARIARDAARQDVEKTDSP